MGAGGSTLENTTIMKISDPSSQGSTSGKSLKCVVTGDHGAGKSCLIATYTTGKFPQKVNPTAIDNYNVFLTADGKPVQLGIWDTVGTPDHDRLRPLSYEGTEVFLICFDVNDKTALDRVKSKWYNEIRYHSKDAAVICVGLQTDRRQTPNTGVKPEDGQRVAHRCCKDVIYIECSAMQNENIKMVFDLAVTLAMAGPAPHGGGGGGGGGGKKAKKPVIYLYPTQPTPVHVRVQLHSAELVADYPPMLKSTATDEQQQQQQPQQQGEEARQRQPQQPEQIVSATVN